MVESGKQNSPTKPTKVMLLTFESFKKDNHPSALVKNHLIKQSKAKSSPCPTAFKESLIFTDRAWDSRAVGSFDAARTQAMAS